MTDYDRLKALLDSFGVGYKEDKGKEDGVIIIYIEEGYDKVRGYPFFYCGWFFSVNGSFTDMGIWE